MAARKTPGSTICAGLARVLFEPWNVERFVMRWRRRVRKLERGGTTVRERVESDLRRMVRRVG